ncbi:MAG: Hsp20/alpha crystallin family protein [bacterium]|nr:Hsp20/alpha crystallin family protein [bacterium]
MDEEINNSDDIFAELAKARSSSARVEIETEEDESDDRPRGEITEEAEGQLTVDVFQDEDNIYVQSAVAGIDPDNLDVNITKEAVTIRGKRERTQKVAEDNYFYQECFWGSFSRSIVLPEEVDPDRSTASLKNGVLTVKMPKFDRKRVRSVKVRSD